MSRASYQALRKLRAEYHAIDVQMNATDKEALRRLLLRYDPIHAVSNAERQKDEYDLEISMVALAGC